MSHTKTAARALRIGGGLVTDRGDPELLGGCIKCTADRLSACERLLRSALCVRCVQYVLRMWALSMGNMGSFFIWPLCCHFLPASLSY